MVLKITIVTVSFNSVNTIADTLRSVACQTYPNIEHIVIDGGSTDGTVQVVRDVGQQVSRLISEPDRGIYDAMNKGLACATGDVIGFLNADDMLAEADSLLAIAKALEDADLVYGDLVYVHARQTGRIIRHWRAGEFQISRLKLGWMPPHPTFYFRRSRFSSMGFDLRYRIAADYAFMLRCLLTPQTRVAYLPRVLVRMRTGGASNRSLRALWQKSNEDLRAMREAGVGGVLNVLAKNLRKIPQFLLLK